MPRKFQLTRKKKWLQKRQARKGKGDVLSRVPDQHSSESSPLTLDELHLSLPPLTPNWSDQTKTETPLTQVRLCKIQASVSTQPLVVSHSLLVNPDLSWSVFVHSRRVQEKASSPLSVIPDHLNSTSLAKLISILDSANICPGNSHSHYVEMAHSRKGIFVGNSGEIRATLETTYPVVLANGEVVTSTVRTTECDMLVHGSKCGACKSYESLLRATYSRWSRKSSVASKYANNRYLNTPQKVEKLKATQDKASTAEKEIKRLQEKIQHSTAKSGVDVNGSLHEDLLSIMNANNSSIQQQFPKGSFRRLFWDQQLQSAQLKDARQMRWHPTMIKWCLNLKLLSSAAYHSLRTSGFIKLPSERTLRDYTQFFKSKSGFQAEVGQMLKKEAQIDEIPDWKKYVVLLFDEMKIKESLVYDKHSAEVIGFVELGDLNDQLTQLEQASPNQVKPVATHILAIMVRGIFTALRFPFAHFPSLTTTGDQLFSIMWEAIERLERLGFKVIALTSDGASPNRKFFRLHSSSKKEGLCYKTPNPYTSEDRFIFFFSDVPHLIKTTRNCWSHSGPKGTRSLWINGKSILWQHLRQLYDAKVSLLSRSQGLYILKKLCKEHIDLTSHSRMRVDLAVEVLSESVAKAFDFYGDPETAETRRFVAMFDKFFDCLNGRSPDEYIRRLKPNLKPYTSPNDERLTWLEKEFLGYLKEWEKSVEGRGGFADAEKAMMLLSRETIEGLHITVKSFVELTRYLLRLPGVCGHYLLSESFSQDPLENYFGQQRAHGGWCQNPTVQACITSAQSLRVQGSLAMMPVRGNSNRKRRLFLGKNSEKIDNTPLPKKPRRK